MIGPLLFTLQVAGMAGARMPACPDVPAEAVIHRLSQLPPDIREDLLRNYKDMGERTSPLLQTDTPSAVESKYPTSRFVQAVLIKNVWYVQFKVSLFAGVRTLGYFRHPDGHYQISASNYYGGPACETLRAAIKGVYNPGRPY